MKRAQIQMGESIFIVIIVILIIVFGIIFFSGVEEDSIREKQTKFEELSTIQLAQIASALTEIQCSTLEVQDLSCVEIQRMEAFQRLLTDDTSIAWEYYFTQLGNAEIKVVEIYSSGEEGQEWILYYNDLGVDVPYSAKPVIMPVTISNALTRSNSFGVLYITKFGRK